MTAVQGIFVMEGTAARRGLQRNHNTTPVPLEGTRIQNQLNKSQSRNIPPLINSRGCRQTITSPLLRSNKQKSVRHRSHQILVR